MADKAIQSDGTTKRYLPKKAWASLSKEEREDTDRKKRAGSREGNQQPREETQSEGERRSCLLVFCEEASQQ